MNFLFGYNPTMNYNVLCQVKHVLSVKWISINERSGKYYNSILSENQYISLWTLACGKRLHEPICRELWDRIRSINFTVNVYISIICFQKNQYSISIFQMNEIQLLIWGFRFYINRYKYTFSLQCGQVMK